MPPEIRSEFEAKRDRKTNREIPSMECRKINGCLVPSVSVTYQVSVSGAEQLAAVLTDLRIFDRINQTPRRPQRKSLSQIGQKIGSTIAESVNLNMKVGMVVVNRRWPYFIKSKRRNNIHLYL
ncbi:hypothetical protein WA026_014087 [Henosepilachna vigintioctopunctata]|uniref:Uncharacterized protein n=1 Tax=Henosepilachna vigintioctopunctata TaxID=420089 RepID=A0AAW1TMZ9_9CUCU